MTNTDGLLLFNLSVFCPFLQICLILTLLLWSHRLLRDRRRDVNGKTVNCLERAMRRETLCRRVQSIQLHAEVPLKASLSTQFSLTSSVYWPFCKWSQYSGKDPVSFQTCMTLFLLQSTKKDILKNVDTRKITVVHWYWKQLYVQKQFKTQQNVVFYVIEKKYTHTGLEQHEEWFSGELSL